MLTNKPLLAVVNIGEDQLEQGRRRLPHRLSRRWATPAKCCRFRCSWRPRRRGSSRSERAELLEGLGLGSRRAARVVRAAYDLLGLRTFLTTGDKESRAWTFRAGAKAPECAGVIHTDLQRGFIRAEVIHWDELLAIGSWPKAKEANKLRVEGKDYVVQDGDVLEVRFNV